MAVLGVGRVGMTHARNISNSTVINSFVDNWITTLTMLLISGRDV